MALTLFSRPPAIDRELSPAIAAGLLAACPHPALLADRDGVVIAANGAWKTRFPQATLERAVTAVADSAAAFQLARAIHAGEAFEIGLEAATLRASPVERFALVQIEPTVAPAAVAAPAPASRAAATVRPATARTSGSLAPARQAPAAPIPATEPPDGMASAISLQAGRRAALIDAAPIGIATLDSRDPASGTIQSANTTFAATCGGGAGARFSSLIDPDFHQVLASLQPGATEPVELELLHHKGRLVEVWLIPDGSDGVSLMVQDITQRREMQTSLSQNSKLEIIGELASRIAHDLNNNLNVIDVAKVELVKRHPLGDPSYPFLMEIENSVTKGAEMIRQLLNYSRRQTVRRQLTDISAVITDFQSFVHRLVDKVAEIQVRHQRGVPEVLIDQNQLEGLVMNLSTNARDAIRMKKDGGRGTITIETRSATSDDVRAALEGSGAMDVPDCAWAVIAITDTGTGIPEDIREQIFNPFFTTKPVGEGTGIGMASIYGIVKKANGYITLDTEVGRGTTFTVWLPEAASQASAEELEQLREAARAVPVLEPGTTAPVPAAADLAGRGRMLFVEDEDGLRRMICHQFQELGYDVIGAGDGEEALEILTQDPGGFEFVLTDVRMDIMDGPEFLRRGKPYLGGAKVLVMTGYAEADLSELLESERSVALVTKPYTFADLAERVKQMQAA